MGRVLFPTGNDIGVRTLSGMDGADYAGFRAPAEPAPRGASNPVTLGVAVSTALQFPVNGTRYWGGTPIIYRPPITAPNRPDVPVATSPIVVAQPFPQPKPPVVAAPPPVIQQSSPTPVVTIPPASPVPPLVTSGGGTASPNIAPAAPVAAPTIYTTDPSGNIINAQTGAIVVPASQAASTGTTATSMNSAAAAPASSGGFIDSVAAWLGGTTPIGTWSVPNALLAGAVILGFAFLEGGGSSTARRR